MRPLPRTSPARAALAKLGGMKPFSYLWLARALAHPNFNAFDYLFFLALTVTFFFAWRTLWRLFRLFAAVFSRLLVALFLAVIVQGVLFVTGPYQAVRRFSGSLGSRLERSGQEL